MSKDTMKKDEMNKRPQSSSIGEWTRLPRPCSS
jgi:hypothetical protein